MGESPSGLSSDQVSASGNFHVDQLLMDRNLPKRDVAIERNFRGFCAQSNFYRRETYLNWSSPITD